MHSILKLISTAYGPDSPTIIYTTPEGDNFLNKLNLRVSREGIIDPRTKNKHYLCYQCSINGIHLLVGNLKIRDKRDEPFLPTKKRNNF